MPQKAIAELFGVGVPAISKHLANIFHSGELVEGSVVSVLETTAVDGKLYRTKHYNLDSIIAVGYRVNSYEATQFRIWATKTLREFVVKGFVLDDARLEQGARFGQDYFEELLERIREIRASERRFYQKIADIYALASDYDRDARITKDFFATVQLDGETQLDRTACPSAPGDAAASADVRAQGRGGHVQIVAAASQPTG